LAKQGFSLSLVARPAVTFKGQQRQVVLRARITLLGGAGKPFGGF